MKIYGDICRNTFFEILKFEVDGVFPSILSILASTIVFTILVMFLANSNILTFENS